MTSSFCKFERMTEPQVILLSNEAWNLFQEEKRDEAFAVWERLLDAPPVIGVLRTYGEARLLAGHYRKAAEVFERIRLRQAPKIPVPQVGTALWLDGAREAACQDWAEDIERNRSGALTHMDAAGGVQTPALLWFASVQEDLRPWRSLAVAELTRLRTNSRLRRRGWPGPIGDYLLGDLSKDELLGAVDPTIAGPSPQISAAVERNYCVAHFYVAASYKDSGREQDAAAERDHIKKRMSALDFGCEPEMWLVWAGHSA